MIDKKVGIIGCGNMGEALLAQLSKIVEKSTRLMVCELDAEHRDYIQSKYKLIVGIDNNALVKFADVIIIAVKPQDFKEVLTQELCCGVSKEKLVVSIAAGISTSRIEKMVGGDIPVIRAMPNMCAKVTESMTAICAGSSTTKIHIALAREIFSTIGDVVEVDESLMDGVTALSGSGPAYFFYLIESMMEAAKSMGFDYDTARRLVLKTALGSAKLIAETGARPSDLIKRVASKGGTTEAAFKIFTKGKFNTIVRQAILAAHKRSKEISER